MAAALAAQPPPVSDLDDELAAFTLQLEEIELFSASRKGKNRITEPLDIDLAAATFQQNILLDIQIIQDLKCARSIAEAVSADGGAVANTVRQEAQDGSDRRLAIEMTEDVGMVDPPLPVIEVNVESSGQVDITDFEFETDAGPSGTYLQHQQEAFDHNPEKFECEACLELFYKTFTAPCGHEYCADCLKDIFMSAAKDESCFPPRCCQQQISLSLVAPRLSLDELVEFTEARSEFTSINRIYCHNPLCGKFIPDEQIKEGQCAECGKCGRKTCVHCKRQFHTDECTEDEALNSTLDLAKNASWQRCRNCKSMVELEVGCFHITCKCKAQFCYLCGAPWKTCLCVVMEDNFLLRQAAQMVNRAAREPLPAAVDAGRIAGMRDVLGDQHECRHQGVFVRVTRPGEMLDCEMCGSSLRFIMRCAACRMEMCQRCRRNRI